MTHLNFRIDAKEAVLKPVKKPSLTRAYVEKHALPGENWEAARERLRAERARIQWSPKRSASELASRIRSAQCSS